eukprot:TRINITY_DN29084_c0_g1_i2.p1 TRINITY_DN29084_c0_g1~~TRINITY_DN29084_c0_g1_i2.p1  ORF type:complete len:376 (-),score=65.70 TRINITY_DN29084_c0_g1_i2:2-1129(-)
MKLKAFPARCTCYLKTLRAASALLVVALALCRGCASSSLRSSHKHLAAASLRRAAERNTGWTLRLDSAEADGPAPIKRDVPGVLRLDLEPLEADRSPWASNPKNGTPWHRYKRAGERGESSHPHFGGLLSRGDFRDDLLRGHNAVRLRAGLSAVSWDAGLASLAAARVHRLAGSGCYIKHSGLEDRWETAGFQYVGENLYKVINMRPTGVDVVDAWYAEIDDYQYGRVGASCTKERCADRASPPCTLGHFTQVMWQTTTHIGCAREACPGVAQETFIVACHYGPGGNIVGSLPFPASSAVALGVGREECAGITLSSGHDSSSGGRRRQRSATQRSGAGSNEENHDRAFASNLRSAWGYAAIAGAVARALILDMPF